MAIISTTNLRANISEVIDAVTHKGMVFGVGRRNKVEAYIIPAPQNSNSDLDDITNFVANSPSYDFLEKEPDLYTLEDCEEVFV